MESPPVLFSLPVSPSTSPANFELTALWQSLKQQDWPKKCLYIVATPIGNLGDISLRALWALQHADYITCEDTRQTQRLLVTYGIEKKCSALHQHNENQQAQRVLTWLQDGARVVYVSDAGTPAISDPGARLVAAVRKVGLRILPVPGASAVTTLLSAAGVVYSGAEDKTGFRFIGFLPSKTKMREAALLRLQSETQAVVLLEAPHRMLALAQSMRLLGTRLLTVGRELTKQFEEVHTLTCAELGNWLKAQPKRQRGEFSLVLHPLVQQAVVPDLDLSLLKDLLVAGVSMKTAVQISAKHLKVARNVLYDAALALQRGAV